MVLEALPPEQQFCLEGCRNFKQYCKMRQQFEGGFCPFCQLDRSLNKVLWENDVVFAWKVPDDFMRSELAYHGIVVPKRHVRFVTECTDKEWLSIKNAIQSLNTQSGYLGGILHVREGNMVLNAGTVPHLHFNIFMPNGTGEVRIPVCKSPADREENKKRAAAFAARYEQGDRE